MKADIMICGPSASGKSTSMRNLDRQSTVIINAEGKPLPFRHASEFTKQFTPATYDQFLTAFKRALVAPGVDTIVVDSFSGAVDLLYQLVIRFEQKDSRAAWGVYRDHIYDLLELSKSATDRHVVWLALESALQDDMGRMIKTVDIQGSWKSKVESQFTVVLWSTLSGEGDYVFQTNSDGRNTAKSPMGMFEEPLIPNDLAATLRTIDDYYQPTQETAA